MENKNQSEPKPILETSDFRMYPPIKVTNAQGEEIVMQLCEDRDPESGRWEPFYTYPSRAKKNLQNR